MNSENIKKTFFLFGLLFAQISNFVFLVEEAIPIEEFFIFDIFLITSLFIIIFKELNVIHSSNIVNYTCLLGALNNFVITLFFLLWGLFFPEKDMAFVEKIGINGNFQIAFDFISLVVLNFLYTKYKNEIGKLSREKVVLYEVILIFALSSTLLFI